MNIIYLRVSKEDESKQNPEQQLNKILEKFKLKDYKVYTDRGSAYDLKKIKKRESFIRILDLCFNSKKTTIENLYLNEFEQSDINLYVWDYSRIIRNIELNLFFSLLSYWFGVKVHSYKDKQILKENKEETPTQRLTRLMMNTISAFSSEEYSYTISTNTKKSYDNGFSVDKNGKRGVKWGNKFKGTLDNPRNNDKGKVDLTRKELASLNRRILFLVKDNKHKVIIEDIKKRFKIKISSSYISKVKNLN